MPTTGVSKSLTIIRGILMINISHEYLYAHQSLMLRHNYEVTNNFIFIVQFSLVDNKLSRPDRISTKCL